MVFVLEGKESRKIPAQVPMRSLAIGSLSCRRTWGTQSRRNLIQTRPVCRNARSVCWAVGKASTHTEVTYGKKRIVMVISKSSFFLRSQKRRISRGYCRDGRPRRVYWAIGPVRGHSILRGRVNASVGVQASEWVKGFGFKVPRSMFEDRFHLGLTGQRSKGLA